MYYHSRIPTGYDTQMEWSFWPEDPNENTGIPCKTQNQYLTYLLPETYPWVLYTLKLKIKWCQRRISLIFVEPDSLKHKERQPKTYSAEQNPIPGNSRKACTAEAIFSRRETYLSLGQSGPNFILNTCDCVGAFPHTKLGSGDLPKPSGTSYLLPRPFKTFLIHSIHPSETFQCIPIPWNFTKFHDLLGVFPHFSHHSHHLCCHLLNTLSAQCPSIQLQLLR